MTLGAWRDGWRRVRGAPVLLAGVFVATLLAALPLALTMRALIETHLGRSLAAAQAAEGVNWDWWQEFTSQAVPGSGALATAFTPSIIGFAATLDSVSDLLDAQAPIVPVAAAVATYLLIWTFLSGGIIDRYARQRRTRTHGFFAAAGVFFWRFLRLGLAAVLVYGFLFTYVHGWLFDDWYPSVTRNLDVERTVFLWRSLMYVIFGTLLVAANIVFDYARVRMVVEDRRSAVGAVSASLAFIRRHPASVLGLYALNTITFLAAVGLWAAVAPSAGGAGASMWMTAVATQCFIGLRLALKLQYLASQTALFQQQLAHAGYTRAPLSRWPDSPVADLIGS